MVSSQLAGWAIVVDLRTDWALGCHWIQTKLYESLANATACYFAPQCHKKVLGSRRLPPLFLQFGATSASTPSDMDPHIGRQRGVFYNPGIWVLAHCYLASVGRFEFRLTSSPSRFWERTVVHRMKVLHTLDFYFFGTQAPRTN